MAHEGDGEVSRRRDHIRSWVARDQRLGDREPRRKPLCLSKLALELGDV